MWRFWDIWDSLGTFTATAAWRRDTQSQFGLFGSWPIVKHRANLRYPNITVNRHKYDPLNSTCHQDCMTFIDKTITVTGFSSCYWWVKNNDDQPVPGNRLHFAFMLYQLCSLLKKWDFFMNTFFSCEHQNIGLKHLIQSVCFAWCDGTQSSTIATHRLMLETEELSFNWSCLPVTFLKYDWLENKKQRWPRDWWELQYVSPFEVLPAVVMAGLQTQTLNVGLCVFPYPSPAVFLSVLMQRTGALCLCFDCGILMSVHTEDLAFYFVFEIFNVCCLPHNWNILVNTPGPAR